MSGKEIPETYGNCSHPMDPNTLEWDEVWWRIEGTNNFRCRYCGGWWL